MPPFTNEEIENIGQSLGDAASSLRLWYNKKFYPKNSIQFTLHGQKFRITDQAELRKMDYRFNGLDLSHLDPNMDFINPLTGKSLDEKQKMLNRNMFDHDGSEEEPYNFLKRAKYTKTHTSPFASVVILVLLWTSFLSSRSWIKILYDGDITILKFLELLIDMCMSEFFVILLGHSIQMAAIHRYIPDWIGYLAPSITYYQNKKWKLLYHDRKLARTKNDQTYQNSQDKYEITQSINEIETMTTENPETSSQILKAIAKHSFRTYSRWGFCPNKSIAYDFLDSFPQMLLVFAMVRAILLGRIWSFMLIGVIWSAGLKNLVDTFYSNCLDYIMEVPKWAVTEDRPIDSEINDSVDQARSRYSFRFKFMDRGSTMGSIADELLSTAMEVYFWVNEGHLFIDGFSPTLSWRETWATHLENLKEINVYWRNPDKLIVKEASNDLEKLEDDLLMDNLLQELDEKNMKNIEDNFTYPTFQAIFNEIKNDLKTLEDSYA